MPVTPNDAIFYTAGFTANGIMAGFDVNQSGYGETQEINQTVRMVPWAVAPAYTLVVQNAGFQPITRQYNVTLYSEKAYQDLKLLVGATGVLISAREGAVPGQPEPAMLTRIQRGNYQYPGWPSGTGNEPSSRRDLQTAILNFLIFAT